MLLTSETLLKHQISEVEEALTSAAEQGLQGEDWTRYEALVEKMSTLGRENKDRLNVARDYIMACPVEAQSEGYNNANLTFQEHDILTDDAGNLDAEATHYCEYWEMASITARDYLDLHNLPFPNRPVTLDHQKRATGSQAPGGAPNHDVIGHMIYDWNDELARVTTDDTDAEMAQMEGGTVVINATAEDVLVELPPRRAMDVMSGSTWDEISGKLQRFAEYVEAGIHEPNEDLSSVAIIPSTPMDMPLELVDRRMDTLQSIYDPGHDMTAWIELQELLFSGHHERPINTTRLRTDATVSSFNNGMINRDAEALEQESIAIGERLAENASERSAFGDSAPGTYRSDAIDRMQDREIDYALDIKKQSESAPETTVVSQNDELRHAAHQRDVLAKSIADAAQKAGIVESGVELSGPQLLMAVGDLGMAARETVDRNQAAAQGHSQTPDFNAVRGKRKSELSPEQQQDARELWLRENIEHLPEEQADHIQFLLDRLDDARQEDSDDLEPLPGPGLG